jgi:hypothetical protein
MTITEEFYSQTKRTLNLYTIKSIVQSRTCPVHSLRPVVNIRSEFTDVSCCCDYFKWKCLTEIRNLLKTTLHSEVRKTVII